MVLLVAEARLVVVNDVGGFDDGSLGLRLLGEPYPPRGYRRALVVVDYDGLVVVLFLRGVFG